MITCRRVLAACAVALATLQLFPQAPFDLDPGFQTPFMTDGSSLGVNSVLPLPDGDVIVSGQIKFPGDPSPRSGCRLNADGTRDTAFEDYPQMGGKLVAWNGRIYQGNGQFIRRSWPDGTSDTGFIQWNMGPYFVPGQGGDYHVYPDGRVLVSGSHDLLDSIRGYVGLYELIWFQNTGYLDTTAHHRNCNGVIYEFEPQPDGKFVCSGWCTVYEGQPVHQIFRVHPDGALDTTFATDFDWGEADAFTVLDDGRILASGYLRQEGAADTIHFVRLMPDGSLDGTFNNDLEVSNVQYDSFGLSGFFSIRHTVLPDGRIVIHGNFDEVEGEPRRGIALLDSNGYLLDDYFAGNGCGDYIGDSPLFAHMTWGMTPAPDGSWYIHGSYHGYDDGTANYPQQRFVSRLYGLDVGVGEQAAGVAALQAYPNPGSTCVAFIHNLADAPTNAYLTVRDMSGREVRRMQVDMAQGQQLWDVRAALPGAYAVQLVNDGEVIGVEKLIVQP